MISSVISSVISSMISSVISSMINSLMNTNTPYTRSVWSAVWSAVSWMIRVLHHECKYTDSCIVSWIQIQICNTLTASLYNYCQDPLDREHRTHHSISSHSPLLPLWTSLRVLDVHVLSLASTPWIKIIFFTTTYIASNTSKLSLVLSN